MRQRPMSDPIELSILVSNSSERSNTSSSKCRPFLGDALASSKMPRTDSFKNSSSNNLQQMNSPTDSTTTTTEAESVSVPQNPAIPHESHILMPPPSSSYQVSAANSLRSQPIMFPQQQYKQSGFASSLMSGLQDPFMGARYPFTSLQWAELEHQALIFKYIRARAPIPPELIAPIRNSILQHNGGWNGGTTTNLAGQHTNHLDAEPGRCRRTDGKKWRCARPIVPDQKYCERHINRGRHKKKNPNPNTTSATSNNNGNPSTTTTTTTTTTTHVQGSDVKQHQHMVTNQHLGQEVYNNQMSYLQNNGNGCGGSVYQAVPLGSNYGALSMKDRYLNGLSKSTSFPEQLLFSEISGGSRTLTTSSMLNPGVSHQQQGGVSHHGGVSHQPMQKSTTSSSTSSNPEDSSYYSKYFSNYAESDGLNSLLSPQEQQQVYFVGEQADKKPDTSAALRQLFNEWPRSRDASTMTSWSDSSDDRKNVPRTHLSISIPATETSDGGCPPDSDRVVGCPTDSDRILKLSMMSNGEDLADSATNGWFSAARPSVGGPLAEAFNASEAKSAVFKLNYLQDRVGYSPTGVLQKATVGSFSESSSSASSPGSIKVEQLH